MLIGSSKVGQDLIVASDIGNLSSADAVIANGAKSTSCPPPNQLFLSHTGNW